jgi:hypothetical protein
MTHHRSIRIAARAAATLACALLSHGAQAAPPAGALADPTRPPAALMAPGGLAAAALPHQANRDTARAIAAAQRAADPPPPPAPMLVQAVQLPAPGTTTRQAVALVDGRMVQAGDQLDGRTVLTIDAQGVLLKGPTGTERLWLLSGAPKLAAGSITQSRTARYQATPSALPEGSEAQAVHSNAPTAPIAVPVANPATSLPANNSAAPMPMSLAKRIAP